MFYPSRKHNLGIDKLPLLTYEINLPQIDQRLFEAIAVSRDLHH